MFVGSCTDFGQQIGLSECFVEILQLRPKCLLSLPGPSHQAACPGVCFCPGCATPRSTICTGTATPSPVAWRGPAASGLLTVRHVWGAIHMKWKAILSDLSSNRTKPITQKYCHLNLGQTTATALNSIRSRQPTGKVVQGWLSAT